jgi:hypothetical protein
VRELMTGQSETNPKQRGPFRRKFIAGGHSGIAMTFKSKIDGWMIIVLAIVLLVSPVMLMTTASRPRNPPMGAGGYVILIGVVVALPMALVVWLFSTTNYTLTDTDLVVRAGPIRETIALSSIHKITATRSILSAPALSLDRIEIAYGKYGTVVISPDDKQAFVNEMRRRVANLVVGDGLGG